MRKLGKNLAHRKQIFSLILAVFMTLSLVNFSLFPVSANEMPDSGEHYAGGEPPSDTAPGEDPVPNDDEDTDIAVDGTEDEPQIQPVGAAVPEMFADSGNKYIALTFDGRDNITNITAALGTLKNPDGSDVHATFFVAGERVASAQAVLTDAESAGHELGMLGNTGNRMNRMTAAEVSGEVEAANATFELAGLTPVYFRAPKLNLSRAMKENAGLPVINGKGTYKQDSGDDTGFINELRTATTKGAQDGDILQFFCKDTNSLNAFKQMAQKLINDGFSLVSVSELAEVRGVSLEAGMQYDKLEPPADGPVFPTLSKTDWTNLNCPPITQGTPEYDSKYFTQSMDVDPNDPDTIYVCIASHDLEQWSGVWKSADRGATWEYLYYSNFIINVKVDPFNSNRLYVASGIGHVQGFYTTMDGGLIWTRPAGYDSVAGPLTYDMYSVVTDPADGSHILMGFHNPWSGKPSAGVIESFDGGNTFRKIDPPDGLIGGAGMNVYFLYDPDLGIGDSETWLFATQSGSSSGAGHYKTTDSGKTWIHVSTNAMQHGGGSLYYTHDGILYVSSEDGVLISRDNGDTFELVNEGWGNAYNFCVAGDGNYIYVNPAGKNFLRTPVSGDGKKWTAIGEYLGAGVQAFAMVPDMENRIMYTSAQRGVFAIALDPLPGVVLVDEMTIEEDDIALMEYSTVQLTLTIKPEEANRRQISWTSSNSGVAKVDAFGLVTAVSPGTAIITVREKHSGVQAQCSIKVDEYEAYTVPYIDKDGAEKSADAEAITADETGLILTTGWYALEADVTLTDLRVEGDVSLILCDGFTLTANGVNKAPGVDLRANDKLTIYGQTNQTGKLVATGAVGIGPSHGGDPGQANVPHKKGGTLIVNGGVIQATGNYQGGAGIGGAAGNDGWRGGGQGGTVIINRGTVTATGHGEGGAGIGGGRGGDGGTVTINGGTVTAAGIGGGAGIGGAGGFNDTPPGKGGDVIIRDGAVVTASSNGGGAPIGSGGPGGTGWEVDETPVNDPLTSDGRAGTLTFGDAPKVPQSITKSTYSDNTPIVGVKVDSIDGDYTEHEGGAAGEHIYQWKRADNGNRNGNVTSIASTKNYTPTGADYGKYIWVETTPVGDGSEEGTMVQGDTIRVGVKLTIAISGSGGGDTPMINSAAGDTGVIVYSTANISFTKNSDEDKVLWVASPNEGTFGSTSAVNTTYTPADVPSSGDIMLTATLAVVVTTYKITLNANGGSVSPASAQTGADGKLTSLPTPTRSKFTFKGWFTQQSGGTEVTTSTVFTGDTTIFAQWTFSDESTTTTITLYGADMAYGPLTDDQQQKGPGAAIKNGKENMIHFGAFAEASANAGLKDRFYLGSSENATKSLTLVLSVEDDTIPLQTWFYVNSLGAEKDTPAIKDIRTMEYYNTADESKDPLKPTVTKVGRDYYLTFDLTDPLGVLRRNDAALWSEHRSIAFKTWTNAYASEASGWEEAGVKIKSATMTFVDLPDDRSQQDTRFTSRPGMTRLPFFNKENAAAPKAADFSVPVTGASPASYSFALSDLVFAPRAEYMHGMYFEITAKAGTNIKNDCTFVVDLPSGVSEKVASTRVVKTGTNKYAVAVELFENDSGYLGLTSADTVTLRTTKGSANITSIDAVTGSFLNLPKNLEPPPIAVTGVTVSPKTLSLVEGRSGNVAAVVTPNNAANKKVEWSSDKESVAIVNSNGKVTATGVGSCKITATTEDGGLTEFCTVTVTEDKRPKYNLNPTEEDGSALKNEYIIVNTTVSKDVGYSLNLMPYAHKLGALKEIMVFSDASGGNMGGFFIGNSDLGDDPLIGDTYDKPNAKEGWYAKTWNTSPLTMKIAQDTFIYSDVTYREAGAQWWYGGAIKLKMVVLVFDPDNIDLPEYEYTITFNANGGTVLQTSAVAGDGNRLSELPIPTRTGYDFDGWFTEQEGGTKVTTSTVFTKSTAVYAHWTLIPVGVKTITFNPNSGIVSPSSMRTGTDGKLASFPTPRRTNHTFDGWFTQQTGGTKVTTATVFSANATVYAHWTVIDNSISDKGYMTTITLYGTDMTFGPLTDDQRQVGPGSAIKSNAQYIVPFSAFAEASSGNRSNKDRFYLGDAHYQSGGGEAVKYFTLVISVEDDTIPLKASLACMPLSYWYDGPQINDVRSLEYVKPAEAALDELKPHVTKVGKDYYLTFDIGEPSSRLQGGGGAAWSEHRSIGLEPRWMANNGWTEASATVKSATFTFYDLPADRRDQDMSFTSRPGMTRIPFFNKEDVALPKTAEFSVGVFGADPASHSFSLSDAVFAPRAPYLHSMYFEITAKSGTNIKNDCTFVVDLPSGVSQNIAPTRVIKTGENKYSVAVELFEDSSGYLGLTGTDTVTLRTTNGADKVVSIDAVNGVFLDLPSNLAPPPVGVSGVSVSPKTLSIVEGRSRDLTASVSPSNAVNRAVIWSSSDETIAKVDINGKVAALSVGTCRITATTVDGDYTDYCDVTVTADPSTRPKYNPLPTEKDGTPLKNEVITFNKSIVGGDSAVVDLTPYEHKIGALKEVIVTTDLSGDGGRGGAIYANNSDLGNDALVGDDSYSKTNADKGWYGKEVTDSPASMKLAQDTFVYSDVGSRVVGFQWWWDGTNPILVKTITLVFTYDTSVTGVTLSKDTLTLETGNSATLTATVAPSDATNKAIRWSSDDTTVATVTQSGYVTAVGPGNAKITVTTIDGSKTADCVVTVKDVPVQSVAFRSNAWNIPADSYSVSRLSLEGWRVDNVFADTDNNALDWSKDGKGEVIKVSSGAAPFSAIARLVNIGSGEIRYVGIEKTARVSKGTTFDEKTWVIPETFTGKAVMEVRDWTDADIWSEENGGKLTFDSGVIEVTAGAPEFSAILKLKNSSTKTKYIGIEYHTTPLVP